MAGYNHRNTLVRFLDDDKGYGYGDFLANKHLRVAKPTSWRDLFRKYPSGKGMEKDRVYYSRRKKQVMYVYVFIYACGYVIEGRVCHV